jgi:hypothetical protein
VCFAELPELLKAAADYANAMKMLKGMPNDVSGTRVTTGMRAERRWGGDASRAMLLSDSAYCSMQLTGWFECQKNAK